MRVAPAPVRGSSSARSATDTMTARLTRLRIGRRANQTKDGIETAAPAKPPRPLIGIASDASPLQEHGCRFDDRRRRRARLEPELLDRLARDDRDDPKRARLELDLREQPFDLHLADGAAEAIARRQLAMLSAPEPRDLGA